LLRHVKSANELGRRLQSVDWQRTIFDLMIYRYAQTV
jgi:hypothetical protein